MVTVVVVVVVLVLMGPALVTVVGVSMHEHKVDTMDAASASSADQSDATAFVSLVLLVVVLLMLEVFAVFGMRLFFSFAAGVTLVVTVTVEVATDAGVVTVFAGRA